MTNLDSILKSRDITLPTKVHLVKAVVFPVVMYRCEKAEHQKIRKQFFFVLFGSDLGCVCVCVCVCFVGTLFQLWFPSVLSG